MDFPYKYLVFLPKSIEALSDQTEYDYRFSLDAESMLTLIDTYRAFSKSMGFPTYFGMNLNALYDCLTDLAWLENGSVLITISNSRYLCIEESNEDKASLLEILDDACEYWKDPSYYNEGTEKKPVNFIILLI